MEIHHGRKLVAHCCRWYRLHLGNRRGFGSYDADTFENRERQKKGGGKGWLGMNEPDYTINNGQTIRQMQDKTFRRLCPELADWWEDGEEKNLTLKIQNHKKRL